MNHEPEKHGTYRGKEKAIDFFRLDEPGADRDMEGKLAVLKGKV